MRRNTSVILMIDFRNISASDTGRLSAFRNNRLAKTLIHFILTNKPSVCLLCNIFKQSPAQTITPLFNAMWDFSCIFAKNKKFYVLVLNGHCIHQSQKSLKCKKDPSIRLQLSTFCWQQSLELTTPSYPHPPFHWHQTEPQTWFPNAMLFLTKRF